MRCGYMYIHIFESSFLARDIEPCPLYEVDGKRVVVKFRSSWLLSLAAAACHSSDRHFLRAWWRRASKQHLSNPQGSYSVLSSFFLLPSCPRSWTILHTAKKQPKKNFTTNIYLLRLLSPLITKTLICS